MPTNDKRRKVAERLRMLSGHREVDKEFVHDALGLYMGECVDGYDPVSVSELADLIEPEERTCCNVGGEKWGFECSECGGHTHGSPFHVPDEEREELAEMLGGRIVSLHGSVPRFCPDCGARVVADE